MTKKRKDGRVWGFGETGESDFRGEYMELWAEINDLNEDIYYSQIRQNGNISIRVL